MATIPVGIAPQAVADDPRTSTIYAVNELATTGTVSVISGQTNTVVATIPVGGNPFGVAANPQAKTVYVSNTGDFTVSAITCRRR